MKTKVVIIKPFLWGVFVYNIVFTFPIMLGNLKNPSKVNWLYLLSVLILISVTFSGIFTVIDYFTIYKTRMKSMEDNK